MKLRYSPTSPYVRKVLVTAMELGLDDRIERVATDPWAADTDLGDDNPLGKVPALETDDGRVLYDSKVICEYLVSLAGETALMPAAGEARTEALRRITLADGMTDAGILLLVENMRRPEELRWDWWIARQEANVGRAMDAIEAEMDDIGDGGPNAVQIAIACSLGWIDLRFPDMGWRDSRPTLAAWYADFAGRPAMAATAPPTG